MEERKKIALIEDMLELEEGELTAEKKLSEIDEWDSMAKLSLIVLLDDEFGKRITGQEIKSLSTVEDILKYME